MGHHEQWGSSRGTHEIKLEPTKIRLNLPVQAEGKDSKTAIASLAEHKKKVQESLKEMKAIEKSIAFEASTVSSSVAGVETIPT